jgi:hypothetical protein
LEQAILKKVEDALRSAPAEELWADELAARKLVSNIADFTVKYAPDYRPGSENEKKILAPNSPTLENIHKLIGILPNIKVRVLVSSSVGLDETVRRTLAKIRQERGKDSLYSDVFDQSNLGILLAACQKEDGVKTIIVSDASSAGYIEALVKVQPQLFKGVRSFNAVLPQDYSGFRREEKRVYQADVVFKAMVARLADKNGNPFVLDLLKELLDRRLDKGVTFENFIDGITESDNEAVDMGKIVARITNCLKMNVSLVEKIGEQLIILRHFIWTAA